MTSHRKKRRTRRSSSRSRKGSPAREVIILPTKFRRNTTAWARISSMMAARKRHMIKCSKREGKSSRRKAELLDPHRGRSKKSNGDRENALAREFFCAHLARAFSRSQKL